MKKFSLLLLIIISSIILNAQEKYDKLWDEVTDYELQGKYKSASEVVEKILKKANRNDQHDHFVKAFIFKCKFSLLIEETSNKDLLIELESYIDNSAFPVNAILHSYFAHFLEQLYDKVDYKIRGRTRLEIESSLDKIDEWDTYAYVEQISKHYELSVVNKDALKQIPASDFNLILTSSKAAQKFRPTLFDLLMHPYKDFYKSSMYYVNSIYDDFNSVDEEVFGPTKEFVIDPKFTADHIYSKRSAYKAFQLLEEFHIQNDTIAYADIVIGRLKYALKDTQFDNTADLYIQALTQLTEEFEGHEVFSIFHYQLADYYYLKSQSHNARDDEETNKYRIISLDHCRKAIMNFPNSDGALLAQILKAKIEKLHLNIITEKHNPVNKPFLAKVTFRSIDSLFLSFYKIPLHKIKEDEYEYRNDNSLKAFALSHQPEVTKFYELQEYKDYYEYSTELPLPALEAGNYLIVASSKEPTDEGAVMYNYQYVVVTDISLIKIEERNSNLIKALDRTTGEPINDLNLLLTNDKDFLRKGKTDKNGEFYFKKNDTYYTDIEVLASIGTDTLLIERQTVYVKDKKEKVTYDRVAEMKIYLDRAIYRPGQTVYFKGLLIEQRKNGSIQTVPNTWVSMFISDPNNEELKEFRLKTNEFGSVSGEYKLPKDITGTYIFEMDEDYGTDTENEDRYYERIDDIIYAELEFQVEEYKRPKFEVKLNDLEGNYLIGDTIPINGYAKAFLGSMITDAQVTYNIERRTQRSYRYMSSYRQPEIINNGETKTDSEGNFEIKFVAIPDTTADKSNKPIFHYTINADVTDLNGETRSKSITVKLGYHNLNVYIEIAEELNSEKENHLKIKTQNLNNHDIGAEVEFSIYKLKSPERVLRSKPWSIVDYPYLTKEEFVELFPNELYDKSEKVENWEKGDVVLQKKLSKTESKDIPLDIIKDWKSGSYILELTAKDVFLDTLSFTKTFELVHPKEKFLADHKLFDHTILNTNYKTDGYVEIALRTALEELHVILEAFYEGETKYRKGIFIKDGSEIVRIPVKPNYHESMELRISFVRFNDFIDKVFSIQFKEKATDLIIETISFRDKLMPGSEEQWKFKVLNPERKIAYAEIMATMFDASLDEFLIHEWDDRFRLIDYYGGYHGRPSIGDFNVFNNRQFRNLLIKSPNYTANILSKYQRFRYFGLSFDQPERTNKWYLRNVKNTDSKKRPKNEAGNLSGFIIGADDGLPIPGVTVMVPGTKIGTTTDFDGFYSLYVPEGHESVSISFIGMVPQTNPLPKSGRMNIALETSATALEEVVVTALGISREKKALGYSVQFVQAEEVEDHILNVLDGEIAGVNINAASGAAGASAMVEIRGSASILAKNQTLFIIDGVPMESAGVDMNPSDIMDISVLKGAEAIALYGTRARNGVVIITTKKGMESLTEVESRENLKETAFFLPHLRTNEEGIFNIDFEAPEALTRWKVKLMAHTTSMNVGFAQKVAFTQKDINVIPNPPRFMRANDTLVFSTKISNLSEEVQTGIISLQLADAITKEVLNEKLIIGKNVQNFTIRSKSNESFSWKLFIPEGTQALEYKVIAKAGDHSDGESSILPVLTNRMLITETRSLWVPPGKTKEVEFEKLAQPTSNTKVNHKYIFEYTSNPVWLAIKSLPYLIEFPYECAEQTFSRYYANALAENIIEYNPEIEKVFNSWKEKGGVKSHLDENEDLKNILMSETPWLYDLKSDKENKAKLATLFDKEKLLESQSLAISKLSNLQNDDGGFPWFDGGRSNMFITRHIVAGNGHLMKLKVDNYYDYNMDDLIKLAVKYLDIKFYKEHKERMERGDFINLGVYNSDVHYFYSRSFYDSSYNYVPKVDDIKEFYLNAFKRHWLTQSLYNKAMIALILHRNGDLEEAKQIIEALEEQAVDSEENGMYWKENKPGWYWYNSPIETHALLIEAFSEINGDKQTIDKMKQWLIKQRQTTKWSNTKATTEAIYALMMHGSDWMSVKDKTIIRIGGEKIKTKKMDPVKKEAGTGYFKLNWKQEEVTEELAEVEVTNNSEVPGIGGVYWQYFEDLDKVTVSGDNPLKISKELFLKEIDGNDFELVRISDDTPIKLGDKITVRIIVTAEDDMEYVHLKDMRASGFEPIDVLSEYKWQYGVGYYQSTRDVATHFFFDRLPKGAYVFEYELRANNIGNFSNGISTIQSMYAPEFSGHSKGIRIEIKDK